MKNVTLQFLSDVYKGARGDAAYYSSVQPLRCVHTGNIPHIDPARPLFFTPSVYKHGSVNSRGQGRTKENLVSCGVLFLDFDKPGKPFPAYLPPPSYIFERGARRHVYWLLDKPCTDMPRIEAVLKRLARETGADPLPAHPAALMRVPGTLWEKKGKRGPGYALVDVAGKRYPLSSFETAGTAAQVKSAAALTGGDASRTGDKTAHGKAAPSLSGLEHILLKDRKKVTASNGRSGALYQFALRCRDFGAEEMEALVMAAKFNTLYCDPPEPEKVVTHQVTSAYKYAKHPPGRYLSEKPERAARKFEEDTRISESLQPFIYAAEAEILINTENGLRYTKGSQVENALCWAAGVKTSLQYVLTNRLITLKDRLAFRPGEPHECGTGNGVTCYNTYEPLRPVEKTKPRKSDARMFEDHLKYLTNSPVEFEHLRKFLACSLLNPGKKIKHALLLISTHEGIGKSVLQILYEKTLVSIRDNSYVASTSNTEIARGNNSWIESKFVVFVHELGQSEKFAVLDQIKNWITEPRVRISDKYVRSYEIENHANFVFFSNAVNALPIGGTDRRFFVVVNRKPPQPQAYYEKLLDVLTEGLPSILAYLQPYAGKLDVNAPPPVTESKIEMRSLSKNEIVIFLDECLHDPSFSDFFRQGFTLRSLAERLQNGMQAAGIRFSQKQAAMWLRENGFHVREKWPGGKHVRLYMRDNVIQGKFEKKGGRKK